MKCALRWCVVPLLASALLAQTAAKPKPKPRKMAAAAAPAVTADDIKALRDAIAAQGQQIQQLQQQLQQKDAAWQQAQQQLQQTQAAATDAQQKAADAQNASAAQKDSVTKLSSDMADVKTTLTNTAVNTQDEQKRFSAIEGTMARFRWTGDIRVRGESFFQSAVPPSTADMDRQRARLRVRFGFEGKLGEDFVGGLSIATGTLGDPTSTNTTMTNFFDKHTIGLDKAYIVYNPHYFKWVTVTSGKFAYTWQRTNETFDPDLNPEGFTAKFSLDTKTKFLKNVSAQPMLLLFNEASGGVDSYAIGGNFAGKVVIGPLTSTPSFTILKWNNPDAIFQTGNTFATQNGQEGPGCKNPAGTPGTAGTGGASCGFAPNGMTNSTYLDAAGHVHFYSQYLYADFILNNTIKTPMPRLPLNVVLEYENNLDAKDHPLGPNSGGNFNILTGLGKQSHLYLGDISLGQTKNKNDLQFGYMWARQEQDSVIASFDESDQRAPTNIVQNKFYVNWKMVSNITAGYTFWYGRTLNTNLKNAALGPGGVVGTQDQYLKRMQFDLIYAF